MRGRTNVGGGGISLNGTPVNKTVAGGNIIAGDFVEYYSEPSYIEQSELITFQFNIGPYCVALRSNSVVLFKGNQQISAYAGYQVKKICKYRDMIVFLTWTSNYEPASIGVLKIVNDQLVLSDFAQTTDVNIYHSLGGVISVGDEKVIFISVKESGSTVLLFEGYALDISNAGILSNGTKTAFSDKEWGTRRDKISACFNDHIHYIYSLGAGSYNNGYTWKATVDSNNNITLERTNISTYSTAVDNLIAQYGDRLIFNGRTGSGSSSTNCIYTYNVATNNSSMLNTGGYISGIIDGNLFISYKEGSSVSTATKIYVKLFRYDEQANNITLLSEYEYEVETVGQTPITGFNAETDYGYIQLFYNDGNVRLLKVIDNIIQDEPDADKVKPYLDGGHPIGVAKESGAIGSVIPVYIPMPST